MVQLFYESKRATCTSNNMVVSTENRSKTDRTGIEIMVNSLWPLKYGNCFADEINSVLVLGCSH